jgi:hypothetical protein
LKCSCGESVATIEIPENKKISVTVPCMLCSYSHVYTMTQDVFFNNNVFVARCPMSNIAICFVGNDSKVNEAIEASNAEISEMFGDGDFISSLPSENEKYTTLSDPMILNMIKFVINDLDEENKIICDCSNREGNYSCDIFDEHILIKCNTCKKQKRIDIIGTGHAMDFLETDKLILE